MLKPPKMDDPRTYEIIGAAMEVHTGLKLGLLINFGAPSLEHRRFANDKNKTKQI